LECGWDGGDCCQESCQNGITYSCGARDAASGGGFQCRDPEVAYPDCNVNSPRKLGDGKCDTNSNYNTAKCGWDGGDCCQETCIDSSKYACGEEGNYECLDQDYYQEPISVVVSAPTSSPQTQTPPTTRPVYIEQTGNPTPTPTYDENNIIIEKEGTGNNQGENDTNNDTASPVASPASKPVMPEDDSNVDEPDQDIIPGEGEQQDNEDQQQEQQRVSVELTPFVLSLALSSQAPKVANPGYDLDWTEFTSHTSEYLSNYLRQDPAIISGSSSLEEKNFDTLELSVVESRVTMQALNGRRLQDGSTNNEGSGSVLNVALRGYADFLIPQDDSDSSAADIASSQKELLKAVILNAFLKGGGEPYTTQLEVAFSNMAESQTMNLDSWLVFSNIIGVRGLDFVEGDDNDGIDIDFPNDFSTIQDIENPSNSSNKGVLIGGIVAAALLLGILLALFIKRDTIRSSMAGRKAAKAQKRASSEELMQDGELEKEFDHNEDNNLTNASSSYGSRSFESAEHRSSKQQPHQAQTSAMMRADDDQNDKDAEKQHMDVAPALCDSISPMNSFDIAGANSNAHHHIRNRSGIPPPPPPQVPPPPPMMRLMDHTQTSTLQSIGSLGPGEHRMSMPERALRKLAESSRNIRVSLPWGAGETAANEVSAADHLRTSTEEEDLGEESVIYPMNSFETYGDFSYTYSIAGNTVQSNSPPRRAKASGIRHTPPGHRHDSLPSSNHQQQDPSRALLALPPSPGPGPAVPLTRQHESNVSRHSQSTTESGAEFREIQESIKALDASLTKLEKCATSEEQEQQQQQHYLNDGNNNGVVILSQSSPLRAVHSPNHSFGESDIMPGNFANDEGSVFTYTGIASPPPKRGFSSAGGRVVYTEHRRIESTLTQSFSYTEAEMGLPASSPQYLQQQGLSMDPNAMSAFPPVLDNRALMGRTYSVDAADNDGDVNNANAHANVLLKSAREKHAAHRQTLPSSNISNGASIFVGGPSRTTQHTGGNSNNIDMLAPYDLNPTSSGITIKMNNSYEQMDPDYVDMNVDLGSFDMAEHGVASGAIAMPRRQRAVSEHAPSTVPVGNGLPGSYYYDSAARAPLAEPKAHERSKSGGVKKMVRSLSKTFNKRPSLVSHRSIGKNRPPSHNGQQSMPVLIPAPTIEIPAMFTNSEHGSHQSISRHGDSGRPAQPPQVTAPATPLRAPSSPPPPVINRSNSYQHDHAHFQVVERNGSFEVNDTTVSLHAQVPELASRGVGERKSGNNNLVLLSHSNPQQQDLRFSPAITVQPVMSQDSLSDSDDDSFIAPILGM
jgi:hypothetical protein